MGWFDRSNKAVQDHFPCHQCGADLLFSPGQQNLTCSHCGHSNQVPQNRDNIEELDFHDALVALENAKRSPLDETQVLNCPNCAASFEFTTSQQAGKCPFCTTPVVIDRDAAQLIKPKSLLPFRINEQKALDSFEQWLGNLWFAPSSLKNRARREETMVGVYLPFWTYDSHTLTHYHGMRGDIYYVNRYVTVRTQNGWQRQLRRVPQVRWTPRSGQVRRHFDDVLIGASNSLPRKIVDRLAPWDLYQLVSYDPAYLSGFESEHYQIALDEGFNHARQKMAADIEWAIRRDIGGDQQQINGANTKYRHTTYKHILLPVWAAAFKYNGKTYRFVVNGRNGKTEGERPYSSIKIAFAAAAGLALFITFVIVLERSGILAQMSQTLMNQGGYSFPRYRY